MSEPKVPKGSLPNGYSFVPKGNVYITSNCRKLTQECGRSVYIVVDAKNQQIGIGVSTGIYLAVQYKEMETRADRAANVLKRDEGIAKAFQKEIVDIFPQIPSKALHNVVKIALEKGKGKVGRTGKLDVKRKAHLAVWAHIRHCETDYDRLLRSGIEREDARKQVEEKIKEVRKAWIGDSQATRGKPGKSSKSLASPRIRSTQTTKGAKKGSNKTSTPKTAITNSSSSRASKTAAAGQVTNERKAAIRNARRAQRENQTPRVLVQDAKRPAEQEKAASETTSPKVIATAASFREKRAPKPRFFPSFVPTPPSAKSRHINPDMLDVSRKHRRQIQRLIAQISRIERPPRIGRKKPRHVHATRPCTVASLNDQINEVLAGASIQGIECSAAARQDLVRRLRRYIRGPGQGST